MGLGRDARNKILAVFHFQGRIGVDHDFSDPECRSNQVDVEGNEYAVRDMPQGESSFKLRGMTERKKRRGSATTAAPRPQPAYSNSSNSSVNQTSYYPPPWQSASTHGSATYYPGLVQGSPPSMHSSTFSPPSQQYQSSKPNQGHTYHNTNQPYQNQGQQQQQQQQQYNQGYNQTYNQNNA